MSLYYRYKPINPATDAIRLLRLVKGCRDEFIECELFETYLHLFSEGATTDDLVSGGFFESKIHHSDPIGVPYEALSYTWGSGVAEHRVWLGAHQLKVTESLYCALKYLRKPDQDRILWVDALCIDQAHDAVSGFLGQNLCTFAAD